MKTKQKIFFYNIAMRVMFLLAVLTSLMTLMGDAMQMKPVSPLGIFFGVFKSPFFLDCTYFSMARG